MKRQALLRSLQGIRELTDALFAIPESSKNIQSRFIGERMKDGGGSSQIC